MPWEAFPMGVLLLSGSLYLWSSFQCICFVVQQPPLVQRHLWPTSTYGTTSSVVQLLPMAQLPAAVVPLLGMMVHLYSQLDILKIT